MNSWQLFLTINRGNAFWRKFNLATIFVIVIFAIIAIFLATTEYIGFQHFLNDPGLTPDLKPVVVSFTLQSLFLILFALSIASSILISPYLFLKSRDTSFLLTLPIKTNIIFHARFFQQIAISMWTSLIFGIPAIIAINYHYHLAITTYLLSFILFISLIVLGTLISNILLLILFPLIQRISSKLLFLIQVIIIFLLGYSVIYTISPKTVFSIMEISNQSGEATVLKDLLNRFSYWPSGWYTSSSFSSILDSHSTCLNILYLFVALISLFFIQYLLSWLFYRRILQQLQVGNIKTLSSSKLLPRLHTGTFLVYKEWLQIRRTRADFSQFILFFFIFFIYIGMLFQSPAITENIDPIWTPRLIIFIILTTGYFITLMAIRFAFPFTAIEKQENWYNLTLPLDRCCALSARIISIFIPILIIIEAVIVLTSQALKLSNSFTYPMAILAPFLILATIVISVFFGTILPVKFKSNSETISTTPAGLIALVVCFLYILLVALLLLPETKHAANNGLIGINRGYHYWSLVTISLVIIISLWKISKNKYKYLYL